MHDEQTHGPATIVYPLSIFYRLIRVPVPSHFLTLLTYAPRDGRRRRGPWCGFTGPAPRPTSRASGLKNVDRHPTDERNDEVPRPRSRKLQGTVHTRTLPKPLLYQLALDSCMGPRLGVHSPWACLHNKCCCVPKISACKPWLWYLQIGRRSKRFLPSLDSHVQRVVPPGYRCVHHLELPRCASSLPIWPRRLCIHGLSVELRRSLSRLYNMAVVPTVAARFGTLASSSMARKVATGSSGWRRNDSVKLAQDALRRRLQ